MPIQGLDSGGIPQYVPCDDFTNGLETVDTVHISIHRGHAFDYSAKLSIASAATVYLLGKTGANHIHFRSFHIDASDGPIDVQMFEDPTVTANGTVQTTPNRNRSSSNTSTLAVYTGPTVTDDGTQLFFVGVNSSTQGAFQTTSSDTEPEEWILAPNTDYLIKLLNNGAGTATVYASFLWYENIE